MTRKRWFAAAAMLVFVLSTAAGAASAPSAKRGPNAGLAPLVGTWDVVLSLPGAPPGRVLATFMADGTTVESASAPPATRGASHGAWKKIGPSLFSVTRIFFRFNPQTGAFLGTTKVNATARVARDRRTFSAVSLSELRDPAGTVVASGLRGTAQGSRISAEEIPDRP